MQITMNNSQFGAERQEKRFVIVGGGYENKGAQAMVFSAVQALKEKHPESDIWVFVSDNKNANYNEFQFNTLAWDGRLVLRLFLGKLKLFIKPTISYQEEHRIRNILLSADALYDVSGFMLSSHFGFRASLLFLLRIALAKKYKIKMFLLPQSFGPFSYRFTHKALLFPLMKLYLNYPVKIFVREKQGLSDLRKFTDKNLVKSLDLVLFSRPAGSSLAFKNHLSRNNPSLLNNGLRNVAIIPNSKLLQFDSRDNILLLYKGVITALRSNNFNIYILRYSQDDLQFCRDIAIGDKNTLLLEENYDCSQLSEFISKMDFIISSRYHAIIHAYKSAIPALVIGWSEKYNELAQEFKQQDYFFDIRKREAKDRALYQLLQLTKKYNYEKGILLEKIRDISFEGGQVRGTFNFESDDKTA